MKALLTLLSVLTIAFAQALAQDQWVSGSCSQFGCPVDTWEWRPASENFTNAEGRWSLWRNGRFVGFWDGQESYYRAYLGDDRWTERQTSPPVSPPAISIKKQSADIPGGVDISKLRGQEECECHLNGGEEKVGFQALMAALDDDSNKLWLVAVGDGREKFLADAQADHKLADLLSRCRICSFPDGYHSTLDRDTKKPLYPTGKPGVILMQADGTALWTASGPKIDVDALRKADPNFKPDASPVPPAPVPNPPAPKPPDAKKPDESPAKSLLEVCVAAIAGGVVTYVLKPKGS